MMKSDWTISRVETIGGRRIMRGQLTLNDGQARQALAMLLSEGKIKGSDIRVALAGHRKRVEELRAELRRLEGGDGQFPMDRVGARRPRPKTARVSPVRKAKRVSPKRRRAMRQQGRYLGAVGQLRPADRAKVKAVRAEKGFTAAIAEARRLMGAR
jgi:hypothetical protein